MKKKTSTKKKPSPPIRAMPGKKKKLALKSKRTPKKSSAIRKPVSVGKKIKTKKVPTKRATNRIRKKVGSKSKSRIVSRRRSATPITKHRIVRIMGQGQFTVNNTTLKKLNEIDDSIVQLVSTEKSDDIEFRKRLTELTSIVESNGNPLDPKEIIQSDIILPSTDLSIDEAKRLFKGEGVIPET
jgi:hypothetical protein